MRICLLIILACSKMNSQPTTPHYTAVTVKRNIEANPRPVLASIPPGPLRLKAFSLRELVARATGMPSFQVIGGPTWADSERWDLQLETDPVIMHTAGHAKLLLQAISDQFGLRIRRKETPVPVYELSVADAVFKLRADPDLDARGPSIRFAIGSIHRRNTAVGDFAKALSLHLGRPVLDKTGFTGLFAFELDWTPAPSEDPDAETAVHLRAAPAGPGGADPPPIAQALQQQLGLTLTQREGMVEVIVIDEAVRPRTP